MVRSVTVALILTAVVCVCAAPGQREARAATTLTNPQVGSIGIPNVTGGNFGPDSYSSGHGGNSNGEGDGGHGGNFGNNYYGGSGDTGRITHG